MRHTVDIDYRSGTRCSFSFDTRAEAVAHAARMAMDMRVKFAGVRGLSMDAGITVYGLPDGSSVKVSKRPGGAYYLDVSNKYDMEAKDKAELDQKLRKLNAKGPVGWE